MAAQVEVSSGRQDGVSGCLHLSPLTDSSNTALVEDSSGTHPSLILAPEPRKPLPGPKPRLTPKPFSVERTSIIRPILAPKPQPKPKPESTLPASQKPEHPDSSKPEPSGKPKAPGSRPAPTAFRPDSGAAQRPDAPLPKLAVTPDTVESSKPTPTPRTRVLPTRPAEWSGAVRPRPSGTPIARAKSMGFLSGAGLEDDGEEKAGEKSDPVVLRSQGGRSGRPRPVSAVFLSPPSQPETPPAASGPAPRWGTRRPLSTNLTAKFEPHQRPTKLDSKENIPETSEPKETAGGAAGGATGKRREKEDVETGGRSKALERGPVKEEAKPEEKAGSSIKRRISLLLDSSSSSFSLPTTRAAAPGAEPRSPGPPISDGDGTVGVKQRIRELSEDFSATPTPPKPQFKPRPLPTDLTKRFVPDLENCPADSKGLPNEEATEKSESSLGTEQSASPEDRASREGPDSVAPAPSVGGVQTVRAALFENVVERHNVHMLEDGGPTAQPGGSVTPTPRRSLSGRGTLRPPASVEEEGSLVMATLREASSPPSTRRVGHVFDTVVAVEGTRAVSETLSPAQPEERALALRSRRSEPRGEPRQQSARPTAPPGDGNASMSTISDPHKEQDGQAGRSALETGNTRYLRVGALVKWDSEGVDEESEVERVKQRELLKNMEEELQRQMEVHKAATADMEEEEREIEAERQKQLEAERQKRLEAERQKQLEAERVRERERERRGREREEAAATRQSKVLKAEEPQSTRPRATYFALTGQAHDAPLQPAGTEEHRGTRSAERGRAEVPFDDYSVKVGRWGSPRRAVSMRYKPSEDDAFRRNAPDPQPRARSRERALEHGDQQSSMEEELERERRRLEEYGRMKEMNREKQDRERKKEAVAEERQKTEYERRKELEQQREFEREKERMLDQERLQLREFEKQREMERQKEVERQRELEKERGKQQDRQRDVWRWMQPDQQRAEDRQRGHDVLGRTQQPETRPESETSPQQSRETVVDGQRTSESHLRPKVLDLDTVSLDSRLSRGGVELGSAPQWRLPSGHDAEASRSSVLDVDSFRSQMQPDLSLDPFSTAPLGMLQSHQRYHPNPAFQPSHTSQPSTAPQGFGLPQPLTPERAGVGRQPGSEWLASQSDTWAERETAVDEPLWVSTGGSRRAISGRQSSLEELLQRQENSSPLTTPTAPGPAPRAQGPTPTPTSSIGISMLIPEKVWTPPVDGSSVGGVGSPAPSVGRKESQVSTGQTGTSVDVPEPAWSPNWELTSPEPSQTSHRSTLTQESRARSRSVSRRSPAESSVDGPLSRLRSRSAHREYGRQSWEQVKETVSGQDEARDTDTLVQETDSQYGTWDTGLHTDDSLTPATPSSDGNLTPSPRKPSPPLSPVQAAPADTPTSPAPLSEEKAEPLSFPETPTTLLDSSVLRSRVQLSKRCSRRAPSSRTARHSTALSLLAEGGGDEWRYRDSTEDKPDSLKQEVEEEMDSEEQDQGAESRTPTQPQRVAVFPGMNPSALMAQLKRRGDAATQPDGPVPSTQPSRSPKSPFLPRAARVLPPAANKENREESSPQWLKELKTKKRFSQLETDD